MANRPKLGFIECTVGMLGLDIWNPSRSAERVPTDLK